ncbi:hypothetical protein GALMADRAFT_1364221 [Galerina marginata CBS 339.88]|uniref:Uncharacterized protein n=1 Tax=Galerina marginata (strain CBS 339.88) TaxID=685588 RepID=A0A067T8X3_GALM3|nr:hypothetical protein GALMADRAFT_1364221 [Galerina marginata CBS 339.88]
MLRRRKLVNLGGPREKLAAINQRLMGTKREICNRGEDLSFHGSYSKSDAFSVVCGSPNCSRSIRAWGDRKRKRICRDRQRAPVNIGQPEKPEKNNEYVKRPATPAAVVLNKKATRQVCNHDVAGQGFTRASLEVTRGTIRKLGGPSNDT